MIPAFVQFASSVATLRLSVEKQSTNLQYVAFYLLLTNVNYPSSQILRPISSILKILKKSCQKFYWWMERRNQCHDEDKCL